MLSETLPLVRCKKCGIGTMLPLSDYGQDGAAILYKAWVCDSPTCGYNLRIDRGQVRSEEHTSELQSQSNLVCRLLLEKKKNAVQPAPRLYRKVSHHGSDHLQSRFQLHDCVAASRHSRRATGHQILSGLGRSCDVQCAL